MNDKSLYFICTEPGIEINEISLISEILKNEKTTPEIQTVVSIIMNFFIHHENTSVTINELLEIICDDKDIRKRLDQLSNYHLLMNSLYLPKCSLLRPLPLTL